MSIIDFYTCETFHPDDDWSIQSKCKLFSSTNWQQITSSVKCSWSRKHLRSCLVMEHSRMKTNILFECGPLPPTSTSHPPGVIHVISVPRPSQFFTTVLLPCIIPNANQRTKRGGLYTGTSHLAKQARCYCWCLPSGLRLLSLSITWRFRDI